MSGWKVFLAKSEFLKAQPTAGCVAQRSSNFLGIIPSQGILTNYVLSRNSLKRFYLFIFREKGKEGEREGEKNIDEGEKH